MKHLGDITKINGAEIPPVDCITGGSPCQDLSVAGKRAGLEGERSGLFMEQIRIVKEMRAKEKADGRTGQLIRPRFMVWENVVGAMSSGQPKGADFQAVLTEIVRIAEPDAPDVPMPNKGKWTKSGCIYDEMGRWSIAWRVHDAQYWGVPQRRRRISLVADFGGKSAPEILFEREGLSGDTEPCGAPGEGPSEDTEGRADASSWTLKVRGGVERDRYGKRAGKGALVQTELTLKASGVHAVAYRKTAHPKTADEPQGWEQTDTNDTLNAFDQGEQRTPTIVLENHPADSRVKVSEDGVFQALTSRMGTGGGNVPMVMEDNVTASKASYFMKTNSEDRAQTLVATDYKDPQIVAYGLDRASYNQGKNAQFGFCIDEEKVGAQVAKGPGAVCAGVATDIRNGNESEVNGALQSSSSHNVNSNNTCRVNSIVRRLTPKECERLQGFPDDWTNIGDWVDSKGKKHKGDSDSPRYKALGNSIALPFWRWMARRMVAVLKRDGCDNPTMASLFDGIGGFPLVYTEAGCEPIWASEIEEFPIAVTKLRFPEE